MSRLIVVLVLAFFSGALYAQQNGELWEMSMSMAEGNDPLMPMMNNKICAPKEKNAGERMLKPQDDKNCKTEMKTSGKKTKFKTVCVNDGETTTMEGVQESLGTDHFKSDSVVTIENRKGKQVMRQAMTMKKLGACKVDASPADGMMAEMKKSCGEMAESMVAWAFLDKNGPCKAEKPQFCAKVKAHAEAARDPAKYDVPGAKWDETAKACGVDFPAVTRAACQRSVGARDWYFVTRHCPGETRELAAKHCTGRDYTAIMQSGYGEICRAASPDIARQEAVRDDAEAAGSAPSDAGSKKKDKGKNMLDMGKDMLKSLF